MFLVFFYHAVALEAAALAQPLHDLHETDLAGKQTGHRNRRFNKDARTEAALGVYMLVCANALKISAIFFCVCVDTNACRLS